MHIDSLTLKIQDLPDKEGKMFATVSGKLTLNTGEFKKNDDGTDYIDEEGDKVAVLDDINFMSALDAYPEFKTCIKQLCTEALTLKNLEVNKEAGAGLLSHFVSKRGIARRRTSGRTTKPKRK